ncbi:MAG: glycosyltransferase [Clostridia bacterium]|nr:glycosyltransferase [Clostridia bacterium]
MSSKREGMPVVLLEAKLNRLPIVSYDIFTGPSEIVRNGTDGILVPDGDIEELASAMIKLIENKDLRKQMSDNSQENLEKFSKETILKQWFNLIDSMI